MEAAYSVLDDEAKKQLDALLGLVAGRTRYRKAFNSIKWPSSLRPMP